jgi:hypothetical protein
MTKLSENPSELILIALEDLERCEADPRYEVDMGVWHENILNSKCEVCAAGAVMAQRLDVGINCSIEPVNFNDDIRDKLFAINYLRRGKLHLAFGFLDLDLPDHLEIFYQIDIEYLDDLSYANRAEWKLHMQDLAGVLAAEGY